ncbi:uncharacterized protein LOC34621873 [Cyclospora cayetanensis]|uniref:Uncharacterized protein LOC34621873 n=1 Tax=Cyclospora cayetanensis TaxID=88456 RepID=A0A6P6S3K4_9EIME|nr:uncharacterized protein LOC34621873 [Cyclospora cayetanensis]
MEADGSADALDALAPRLAAQEKLPSAGAAAATLNIPTAPSLATPAADESKRFYIRLHSSSGRCKSGGFCGSACSGTPTCALARRVHHQEELTGLNTCTQLGANTSTAASKATSTAASKAESKAASTTASKAESKGASTTASTAVSNALSKATSKAVSTTASKAALRAASTAVSRTASTTALKAASQAVSTTASKVALKAASKAVSRTASTTASLKAASKAVSTTAPEAASSKAALKALSTTASKAASGTSPPLAASEHSDDPTAVAAAAAEEQKLLAASAAADATRGSPRQLIAAEVPHAHHKAWCSSLSYAEKLKHLLDGRSVRRSLLQKEPPSTASICGQFAIPNHFAMLEDADRVSFYKEAILREGFSPEQSESQSEKKQQSDSLSGLHVLEVGCGPLALLSLLAVQQGAARVDALELNPGVYQFASTFVQQIGINSSRPQASGGQEQQLQQQQRQQQRLRVFRCYSKLFPLTPRSAAIGAPAIVQTSSSAPRVSKSSAPGEAAAAAKPTGSAQLPEEQCYDLVLHEILGDFASQEGVADVIRDIQERSASIPRSIPFAARTFIGISELPSPCCIKYPASEHPERSVISPRERLLQSVGLRFGEALLSTQLKAIEELHFECTMATQMLQRRTLMFDVERQGLFAGFLAAIEVEIRPGRFFGPIYEGQCDSWYTNFVLLGREIRVCKGDRIRVKTEVNLTNFQREQHMGLKGRRWVSVSRPSYVFNGDVLSQNGHVEPFGPIIIDFDEQACCIHPTE